MADGGENNDDGQDELSWIEETRNRPNDDSEIDDSFSYPNQVCCMCEGFYGPCFGEHVCRTCHIFLFPDDINAVKESNFSSEKTDDEDSGNDEPSDLPLGADGFQNMNSLPSSPGDLPLPHEESNAMRHSLVMPSQIDRLTEQLSLLTTVQQPTDIGDINTLPSEILLAVFSYLDDLSLWSVSQVCHRWKLLIKKHFTNEQWHQFTMHRWPLFKPLYPVINWAAVYSDLVESSTCFHCLYRSDMKHDVRVPINPWRTNRLSSEWKCFKTDPLEGIKAIPLDRSCNHWQASITGPANSPYEGGIFYLHIQVPYSYPIEPPSVRFITKVFHPNVSRHGDIGLDCIQENWSLALTISKVLISVQSLLTDPYCAVSMETEVARIYITDRQRFDAVARSWTWKFAMNDAPRPQKIDF